MAYLGLIWYLKYETNIIYIGIGNFNNFIKYLPPPTLLRTYHPTLLRTYPPPSSMIEDKIIETSIDLLEPVEIYAADLPKLLLEKLNARYKGICYSSMLITDIVEIIRYSDRYLVDNRLDGACYVNVQFRVSGIILNKGEILHGCKVVKITNTNTIINHKYAIGMMIADPKRRMIGLVQENQIIPVIIQNVRYNIGKPQISIICMPYIPVIKILTFYNIQNNLSPEDTDKVDKLLTNITKELELHEKIKTNKSYTFFKDITYPYKTQQKFKLTPLGSAFTPLQLTLQNILSIKEGCITLPEVSDDVYHSKNKSTSDKVHTIDSTYYAAISEMLLEKMSYLTMLRGFTEQYDTPAKVENMLAYWKMCKSLKE